MNRLHYFITISKTGSLTKASEILNISQPALSKALKTLESELGHKLVSPSGRGIHLTEYGRKVAAKAEPLLEQIQGLSKIDSDKPISNELKIASFEVFTSYFIIKLLKNKFPNAKMLIHESRPGEMENMLSNHEVEFAISYLPLPHPKVDALKVSRLQMKTYGVKKFCNTDFYDLPFVTPLAPVKGHSSKVSGLDGFPDYKYKRHIVHRVSLLETALQLCSAGEAVGYFPSFIVEEYNKTRKKDYFLTELSSPVKQKESLFDIFLMKRTGDEETQAFKKIASELRKLS